MSEHTPEPWIYDKDAGVVVNDLGGWVARINLNLGDRGPAGRLIAAAPDLLAAMQKIVRTYEEAGDDRCRDLRMANIARSALDKAEGRQP